MPSAIWSGAVGFGLVNVPVKVVTATKSRDVSFNQLEEGTGSRIRYRRVSEASGEEVPQDRIVKGYEVEPGRYVVVEPDELQSLQPKASRIIEIEDFVDLDQIDPLYFEQPYYLVPEPQAAKPYALLVKAMTEHRKVAIGRIVLRSKERLVAIRPVDGVLCAETMRYADEVLAPAAVAAPADDVALSEKELAMAGQLIESLTTDFDPEKYHDEYREQLLDLIERKAAGEEIVASPLAEEPTGKVVDLMAALEASLAKQRTGGPAPAEPELAEPEPAAKRAKAAKAATPANQAKPRKPAQPAARGGTAKPTKARTQAGKAAAKPGKRRSA